MPARNFRNRIDLRPFVLSSEMLIDVPRVLDLASLMLIINGSINITVGATSAPWDSPAGLISRIDLVANGKDVLDSLPFNFLVMANYGRRFTQERTAPGITVATHPIRAVGLLDRQHWDGLRAKDSLFQAYATALLQLRVITGPLTNALVGGTATLVGTTTLETLSSTLDELPKNAQGQTDAGETKAVRKRSSQSIAFTGANANNRIRLPVGNYVRSVTVLAQEGATLAPSDALVNSLSLAINQVDTRLLGNWLAMRSFNRNKVERDTLQSGFAVVDASERGSLQELFDLRNASVAELVVDHNAPAGANGRIDIVVDEFIF
jgi:hypothetical protein